jgi:glycosyltransferase involved in cell wall biosynthesis
MRDSSLGWKHRAPGGRKPEATRRNNYLRSSVGKNNSRIVVVTQGMPHPKAGASVVLFFHYIRILVEAGYEVHSIVIDGEAKPDEESAYRVEFEGCQDFHFYRFRQGGVLVPNRFTIDVNLGVGTDVAALIDSVSPDFLLAFDLGALMLTVEASVPNRVVWLGDLHFQSSWYNFSYGFREDWRTLRWMPFALAQTFAWHRLYRTALSSCSKVIVSSSSSVQALQRLGVASEFLPYPWPNDTALDRDLPRQPTAKPTFLFFGNLVGLGSRSSLHFLLDKVYPRLVTLWGRGGFTIYIGGVSDLRDWAARKMEKCPEIAFEGYIPDLLELMSRCHAVIAPLDVPVGNRSRILTAIAKRALVIAHANAALGNSGLVNGETALLATTADQFVSHMQTAFNDSRSCLAIIDRAEQLYFGNYAPEAAGEQLICLLRQIPTPPIPIPA